MFVIRRSSCHRYGKHKVDKHMTDHLGDQIDEFKVGKRVVDHPADNQITKSKVPKDMADQLVDDQIAKLHSDAATTNLVVHLTCSLRTMSVANDAGMHGSAVIGFNSHAITVQVGEDVAMKVMSYAANGWVVCVLSATGVISNVALRYASSSPETIIYEGNFQILSLSGSYLLSETDGLGICLACPDGRSFGGRVAGPLTAASLVQVVIGRFPVTSGIPGASGSTPRDAMSGSSASSGSPPKN